MLKSEVISETWRRHQDILRSDLELVVNLLFETMAEALEKGEPVEIRGFGRFKVVSQKPRQTRNPKTGETKFQKSRHQVHFKAGKDILKRINGS